MGDCAAMTVVTGDSFSCYVPLFIYSTKMAYPEWDVKVFVIGKLKASVKRLLESDAFAGVSGWEVLEDQFADFRMSHGTPAAARHLIPRRHLKQYAYVYIADCDFIVFRHEPTHQKYHARLMHDTGVPYSSFHSAYGRPWRQSVHGPTGWRGNYNRIAAGTFMIRVKDWLAATQAARHRYKKCATQLTTDGFDGHLFGSYREYDEVMLYRTCVLSGLKVPKGKWKMVDGSRFKRLYRDIHLGDWRRRRRLRKKKMKKLLDPHNLKLFDQLEKDPNWKAITSEMVKESTELRVAMHNLRIYPR
jgi:hypothetical protein